MKRIFCFVLAVLMIFSACSKTKTEPAADDFLPDKEAAGSAALDAFAVNWPSISKKSWAEYSGFSDVSEIPADGLMNCFFNASDVENDFYNSADKTYCFSAKDVQSFLDTRFDGAVFEPS